MVSMHLRYTALGAAAALAIGSLSGASAQELTELNVLTANNTSCSLYPQFVAQETGLNEANGIKTNLLNSETTIPFVAFLDTGDAEYTMLDSAQVLQMANARQPGSVIYEVYNYAPEGIVVMADSPIQSLSDLRDTTVGMASDRDQITTIIALNSIGESLESMNIETVVVGDSGPVMANALTSGTIDAFAGGSSDRANIEAAGIEIRNITPPEVSENPGNSFAMWNARMDELEGATHGFLKAWSMAQHMGVMDTKFVMSVCRVAVPEEFENLETGASLVEGAAYIYQLRRTKLYGEPRPWVWAGIQDPYVKLGEIDGPIDPSTFVTDRFIAGANDWQTIDVVEAIDAWKKANADKLIE